MNITSKNVFLTIITAVLLTACLPDKVPEYEDFEDETEKQQEQVSDYDSLIPKREDNSTENAEDVEEEADVIEEEEVDSSADDESAIDEDTEAIDDSTEESKESSSSFPAEAAKKQYVGTDIHADDIVFGDPNAKIVVIEYFSPTCPHCLTYKNRIFPKIKQEFIDTKQIAYVVRTFIGNKQDLDSSILALCKGTTKAYEQFMEVLLEQQASWAYSKTYRETLTNIALVGGISPEEYANCINNRRIVSKLIQDSRFLGQHPKFIGTPAFFINGEFFTDIPTFEKLEHSIQKALKDQ